MLKLRKSTGWGLAIASFVVLAGTSVWIGYRSSAALAAQDYEQCAESARGDNKQITHCAERFAGRRKPGGGYTYFDFMQNRSFDIAGPNPTADERKQIDSAYLEFLGAQRREMLAAANLAKHDADQQPAALQIWQDPGPPLSLTPKIPLPIKRPNIERNNQCEDGSLACGWAKLSAAVRNAFASTGQGR